MHNISRIEMFLKVVEHASFAAAARSLGMTGPALSKQIQNLEDHLGVRLLQRTTRSVTLTEEGAIYNERARKAWEDLQEAEMQIQEMKQCPTGILKINAPMSFGTNFLTKAIAKFCKEYPDVTLHADFDDRMVDIIGEGYDVVIRIGALKDSSLISRKLIACPILLCASPEFITKYGEPKTPEDLQNLPAITYTKHGINEEWRYQDDSNNVGKVSLKSVMKANNAEMMRDACVESIGIAQIPIFSAIDKIKSYELVQLLPNYRTYPERSICAIFPQNRHLSTKVRLFVDMLTHYTKTLGWN